MAGLDPAIQQPPAPGMNAALVYIMASRRNGTLHIGLPTDLVGRVHTHREGLVPGFTQRYGLEHLVWYEAHDSIEAAIGRETSLNDGSGRRSSP